MKDRGHDDAMTTSFGKELQEHAGKRHAENYGPRRAQLKMSNQTPHGKSPTPCMEWVPSHTLPFTSTGSRHGGTERKQLQVIAIILLGDALVSNGWPSAGRSAFTNTRTTNKHTMMEA